MDINEMKKIKDDTELVNAVYNFFDEKPEHLGKTNHFLFAVKKPVL